jgi:hypothetical protein
MIDTSKRIEEVPVDSASEFAVLKVSRKAAKPVSKTSERAST